MFWKSSCTFPTISKSISSWNTSASTINLHIITVDLVWYSLLSSVWLSFLSNQWALFTIIVYITRTQDFSDCLVSSLSAKWRSLLSLRTMSQWKGSAVRRSKYTGLTVIQDRAWSSAAIDSRTKCVSISKSLASQLKLLPACLLIPRTTFSWGMLVPP